MKAFSHNQQPAKLFTGKHFAANRIAEYKDKKILAAGKKELADSIQFPKENKLEMQARQYLQASIIKSAVFAECCSVSEEYINQMRRGEKPIKQKYYMQIIEAAQRVLDEQQAALDFWINDAIKSVFGPNSRGDE